MTKFEISKRKNGEFQFNLKAANGEIIATSEGYIAKASCQKGIASVQSNSLQSKRFEKLTSKNGKFYFNLKARNGQVIATSEMYESDSNRQNGINSVVKNAPKAKIVDLTKKVNVSK